jgi:hypothetical protein
MTAAPPPVTVICSDCGRRIANTPQENAEFHRGHTHGHGTCLPCFDDLPPGLQDRVLGVHDAKFKLTPEQIADLFGDTP